MSELPDERPETTGPVPPPVSVVWQLLRADDRRARQSREERRSERARRGALGADVARVLHGLRRVTSSAHTAADGVHGPDDGPASERVRAEVLEGLAAKLEEALRRAGVRVEDPTGRSWLTVRDWADPLPGGPSVAAADLVVVGSVQPGVWLDDELIERAYVEVGCAPDRPETDPTDERDDRRDRP